MKIRYIFALKALRLEIRFVSGRKSKSLHAWSRCSLYWWSVFRCDMRRFALCSKRHPPPPWFLLCVYIVVTPLPDACAKNNMDCYMFKCRFVQKCVPLDHEMKNCSNVDQNGNCRTRANLKYSHNKITFVVAVTAVMSRSLVASDRPTGYIHNTFCSNSWRMR
jgi:quinol-cytochrome oxidoreductase complex cytochrome b subunit